MIVDDLGRIPMSPYLTATLTRAAEYAAHQSHPEVTLEHLLLALTEDPEASVVLKTSSVDIMRLSSDVSGYIGRIEERLPDNRQAVGLSADLRRILEAAAAAASQGRRREINGAIVLAAIVGDGKSPAAQMLRSQGLTFEEAIRALQRAPAVPPPPQQTPSPAPGARSETTEDILSTARERINSRTHEPSPAPAVHEAPEPQPEPYPAPEAEDAVPAPMPSEEAPRTAPPQAFPQTQPAPQPVGGAPPPDTFGQTVPGAFNPPPPAERIPSPYGAPTPAAPAPPAGGPPLQPQWVPQPPPRDLQPGPMPPPRPAVPPPPLARAPYAPPPGPPPAAGAPPGYRPPPAQPAQVPPPWSDGAGQPQPRPQGRASAPPLEAPLRGGMPGMVQPGRTRVEAGRLVENIPRKMRVAAPQLVEVRIAKESVKSISEGLQGGGAAYPHRIMVTKAMSVRLRAPEGGFWIESASPDTQWIENMLGTMADDFASWRWTITPKERGKKRLQIIISARTMGDDGVVAETAFPDQVIEVRVSTNYAESARRWGGWIGAAVAGGVLAKFGEGLFAVGGGVLSRLISG